MKLHISTRAKHDSVKVVYLHRTDREYGKTLVIAAGLTTRDSWMGICGMLVIGGFPDCTGGHKATRMFHFRLIGMARQGCGVREPRWLWRPYRRLMSWLTWHVDTRHKAYARFKQVKEVRTGVPPGPAVN